MQSIFDGKLNIEVAVASGIEAVCKRELLRLGYTPGGANLGRIEFEGDFKDVLRANVFLRTANRVRIVLAKFKAQTFDELFDGIYAMRWQDILTKDARIVVDAKSAKSQLFALRSIQSITKKAIVENLKVVYGLNYLPETGKRVIVEVGILRDNVTIALDCCGAGLSRRGYRTYNVDAPISETLGASIVLLTRYKPDMEFIDPMCGSGTMPIEAAMLAENRAPGLNRGFAAEDWHFLPPTVFTEARMEARDMVEPKKLKIYASDIDPRCIDLCKKHAKKAGIMVEWAVKPVSELICREDSGIIVCNPPYGERLMDRRSIEKLYREMRTVFDRCKGHSKNIISSQRDFERIYGLRADKRRKLSNGGMQCTLYSYFRERKDD